MRATYASTAASSTCGVCLRISTCACLPIAISSSTETSWIAETVVVTSSRPIITVLTILRTRPSCPSWLRPRRRRRRHFFGTPSPQSRIGGGELDAVQQNHRLDIHPDQEHDDHGDRAVDAAEARHVADVPGKSLEHQLP